MAWGDSNETAPESRDIGSGAFWPTVATGGFYEQYRIPPELPETMIVEQLKLAIGRVNASLKDYAAGRQADGYSVLADVPGDVIDGEPIKVSQYRRAVYCEAKAEVLKETMTVDRKPQAENAAKTSEETEDKFREFAAAAIRAICDYTRVEVALL